jgi:dihydrofolate synthase/folylpolyglutamate synthase
VVETDPPVVLDGAHNPDAARALADTLAEVFAGRPVALIVGMCGDKDAVRFLGHFSGVARRLWVAGIAGERNMPADTILAAGRSAGLECVTATLPDALNAARDWARDEQGVVCLTGSLFLVGEALETSNP